MTGTRTLMPLRGRPHWDAWAAFVVVAVAIAAAVTFASPFAGLAMLAGLLLLPAMAWFVQRTRDL